MLQRSGDAADKRAELSLRERTSASLLDVPLVFPDYHGRYLRQETGDSGEMKKLKLTRDERTWLREYCKALDEQHPGAVRRLLIYGSKARGQAGPDSDLDG